MSAVPCSSIYDSSSTAPGQPERGRKSTVDHRCDVPVSFAPHTHSLSSQETHSLSSAPLSNTNSHSSLSLSKLQTRARGLRSSRKLLLSSIAPTPSPTLPLYRPAIQQLPRCLSLSQRGASAQSRAREPTKPTQSPH